MKNSLLSKHEDLGGVLEVLSGFFFFTTICAPSFDSEIYSWLSPPMYVDFVKTNHINFGILCD